MADPMTPHVVVATADHLTQLQGRGLQGKARRGDVMWRGMLSKSQIDAGLGPRLAHPSGKPVRALIEHATAAVGDMLSEAEIATALADADQKMADMKARQQAAREVAANQQAAAQADLAAHPPLTGAERAALRKLLAEKEAS